MGILVYGRIDEKVVIIEITVVYEDFTAVALVEAVDLLALFAAEYDRELKRGVLD